MYTMKHKNMTNESHLFWLFLSAYAAYAYLPKRIYFRASFSVSSIVPTDSFGLYQWTQIYPLYSDSIKLPFTNWFHLMPVLSSRLQRYRSYSRLLHTLSVPQSFSCANYTRIHNPDEKNLIRLWKIRRSQCQWEITWDSRRKHVTLVHRL